MIKKESIRELQALATEILSLKEQIKLRRPILIEFCGSPKGGKTTTITSLNIFLKRNGFKTKVLTERAGICPVPIKTHPFFNIWTLCSAVAEIIKHLKGDIADIDIIIADRGIFDALCWFEWLNKNENSDTPYLDDENHKILESFATMDIWRSKLDIIYVFKVPYKTSLEREYANLLTKKTGSIMNQYVLESYNEAIDRAIQKNGKQFRKIITIDTTDLHPNHVGYEVTSTILHTLKEMLIEKIGYFKNDLSKQLSQGVNSSQLLNESELLFGNREKIEDDWHIQPIPIVVITNEKRNKVLVVKKKESATSKSSPEKNKLLLYLGGHVREEDEGSNIFETLNTTLYREIEEEIGESLSLKNKRPEFLIYDKNTYRSQKHIAVCYVISINLDNKVFNPTSEEFILKKGKTKSGRIIEINKLLNEESEFEFWSSCILEEIFGVQLNQNLNLFNYK